MNDAMKQQRGMGKAQEQPPSGWNSDKEVAAGNWQNCEAANRKDRKQRFLRQGEAGKNGTLPQAFPLSHIAFRALRQVRQVNSK